MSARSGHYYVVRKGTQSIRSRSLWDHPVEVPGLEPGETRDSVVAGPRDEQWRAWAQGVRKHGDNLTIWVAEDVHPFLVTHYTYTALAIVLVLAMLVVLLLVQRWLLKRGFRKLDRVRESIRCP